MLLHPATKIVAYNLIAVAAVVDGRVEVVAGAEQVTRALIMVERPTAPAALRLPRAHLTHLLDDSLEVDLD